MISTILIIDDNLDYRTDLAEILAFEKYHTLEAENGLDGLQMIRHFLPDLIICDVDMPVMNGIDVLKTVKTDPTHAKIPFVVTTGHTDTLTMQTLLDLGANTCLAKPVKISEFLMTIGDLFLEKYA
jgi:CheY-like chemotaxis protein